MTTTTTYTTRLRRIRGEHGYSSRRLGALLGCSGEAVRGWELGWHRPHRRYVKRLEAFLGTPLDELLAPEDRNDAGSKAGVAEEESHRSTTARGNLHAQS